METKKDYIIKHVKLATKRKLTTVDNICKHFTLIYKKNYEFHNCVVNVKVEYVRRYLLM